MICTVVQYYKPMFNSRGNWRSVDNTLEKLTSEIFTLEEDQERLNTRATAFSPGIGSMKIKSPTYDD